MNKDELIKELIDFAERNGLEWEAVPKGDSTEPKFVLVSFGKPKETEDE